MKFISLIVFLAALVGSWCLSRQTQPVAESVHVGIQGDLKNIIQNYIQDNVENASDIRFVRMWSETLNDSRVKAHFVYSFADATNTRLEIDGHAILNKLSESDDEVKFSFDELFIQNQSITFDEPMSITAGGGEILDEESATEE